MNKGCGILLVSVTILVLSLVGSASATNWSVDASGGADFTRIQDAINNASDGDTIIVHSDVYYENVYVDKSFTLRGIGHPVVDAGGRESAITLTEDMITLVGFNVTNSGSSWSDVGIKVTSNNNTIAGNNVCNNRDGISLDDSSNNTITGNNVSNNYESISLDDSSNNNIITGNNVSNNREGIDLEDSNNNTITGNNVSNSKHDGIALSSSSNNNTITGNNVSNNNNSGIALEDSNNNTITGNNVSNSTEGISLWDSSNNTITGNNISSNNRDGIRLWDSNNNTITGNTVSNNNNSGISLHYSSNNNSIYLNNFINNTDNVDSWESTTIWNSSLEITYTYDGRTYKSYLGNYWHDYDGIDAEGDGIGDIHYSIDSEGDESDDYPLMKPFENYNISTSALA